MILDVNGNPIDPLWAAEFCGFFLADGSIEIGRFYRKGKLFFRPRARILQRVDNSDFMYAIARIMGGHVTPHASHKTVSGGNGKEYVSRPARAWLVQSSADVQRVIDILKTSRLGHPKVQQALIVERYIQIRPHKGGRLSASGKEIVEALITELQQSRLFKS